MERKENKDKLRKRKEKKMKKMNLTYNFLKENQKKFNLGRYLEEYEGKDIENWDGSYLTYEIEIDGKRFSFTISIPSYEMVLYINKKEGWRLYYKNLEAQDLIWSYYQYFSDEINEHFINKNIKDLLSFYEKFYK